MRPEDCPRFIKCSANFCPFDDDRGSRPHLNGERVCFYLTETVKGGAPARLRASLAEKYTLRVTDVASHPESLSAPIRSALRRAATTGSRIEHAQRLAQSGSSTLAPEQSVLEVARVSANEGTAGVVDFEEEAA